MGAPERALFGLGFFVLLNTCPVDVAISGETNQLVNVDGEKVAIQGYDTVSYFTVGQPAVGLPQYEVNWQGARWRFTNAEHKEMFSKSPDTYAPRFGGFCTWGVADDFKVRADPNNWVIVDGRLYLSAQKIVPEDLSDMPGTVAKAEKNWSKLAQ